MRLRVAEVARKNKGWSMRQLSDELGLHHQTVMYWNQGRVYPCLPTLIKMCRLLECTLEDLLVPEELEAVPQACELLENIPVRRKGHAPQVVTSHNCRMGSV